MRPPATVAHAVHALVEIGVLQVDATGINVLPTTGARLDQAPRSVVCRDRLERIRAFIARAGSLTFAGSAVSCGDARAIG